MIGYATLGTNDLARATAFYDTLLGTIGAKRWMETETFIMWACAPDKAALAVIKPYDGKPATVGNGSMIAFVMDRKDKVDAFHRKALELGGSDEGAPGQRGEGFYAAYLRDLDGNKLNAFFMG